MGEEFTGDHQELCGLNHQQTLSSYIKDKLCFRYAEEFNKKSLSEFKSYLESETWIPLKIPLDFKFRELEDLLLGDKSKEAIDSVQPNFSFSTSKIDAILLDPKPVISSFSDEEDADCDLVDDIDEGNIDEEEESKFRRHLNHAHDDSGASRMINVGGLRSVSHLNQSGGSIIRASGKGPEVLVSRQSPTKRGVCQSAYSLIKSIVLSYFDLMTGSCTTVAFDLFIKLTQIVDLYIYFLFERLSLETDRTKLLQDYQSENHQRGQESEDLSRFESAHQLFKY